MLLPIGAACRSLAGTVEFRAILARTREARTLLAASVVARSVKARLVEIARAFAGGTGIALAPILTLLPRLGITAISTTIGTVTKILARASIGRTARELLVTAKFSLRPIATGTIAIARRPGAERPIATRTVAVFSKTFAARRIGPLLATAFSRGIGLLVAKFPVGKTSRRTRIVAIPGAPLRSLGSLLRSRRGGRSSRLKFGRSPRGLNGRFSPPPRSSRGLNERFSPSSPRDGRPANGLSPRGRGASPKSRRGGRSSPSRLPA